ncbi:MAG: class I SAM-dependent methyltransferase [Clostridiales bacterium]|nr:class I SAM-dependent methyltransferase [Clostridiales bacterium]
MYTGFAEIYDDLMQDVNYEKWADFYAAMMAAYGIRGGKVCECACGTGSLTLPLCRKGFQMTGVDLSQEMLWIAAQKARSNGMGIPYVRQDMRQLHLHRPMDAVLATCDGVNYLLTEEDVLAFFRSAFNALRPGGALFFDVSTPYKLQNTLGDRLICEDSENITYMWQNQYHESSATVEMHLCFFVKQKDGTYRRIDEEQKQKAHTIPSLTKLLRQAGFENISVFGNSSLDAPRDKEQRWHFAALKRAQDEDINQA